MKLSDFELVSQKTDQEGNDQESYFSWQGCENTDCDQYGKGADVYECEGYKSLAEAQADKEGNLYEFNLCFSCIYEYHYGERLP